LAIITTNISLIQNDAHHLSLEVLLFPWKLCFSK